MEPVSSAVGLVVGVGSILSVIAKSIVTLNNLRHKYTQAEGNITGLSSHLRAIRLALGQIRSWLDEPGPNESLRGDVLIDLDEILDHCRSLVDEIDNGLSAYIYDKDALPATKKALFILGDDKTKDCLTRLNHQISALNLFLTAFNW
jgi:hypothetical protein